LLLVCQILVFCEDSSADIAEMYSFLSLGEEQYIVVGEKKLAIHGSEVPFNGSFVKSGSGYTLCFRGNYSLKEGIQSCLDEEYFRFSIL